jgi:aspartate kinase
MVNSRVVVKFGGADLATGEKIRRAAELVVKSPYKEKVVVVSAMGNATDSLVSTVRQIGDVDDEDYAEVLSMGERTSARVFCSALTALGAKAVVFDPADENWPIITDSNFRNATPNMEQTRALVKKFVMPILQETIPVVGGFLGKDPEGHVTTLGRGGSDTTAMLLANCLEADEVILVKETSGVLSADPRVVLDAKPLEKLDVHEMFDLAQGGAKIVKPESLRYKLPDQKLRIVNFASKNLVTGGTEITGSFNINSVETTNNRNLLAINVVCEVNAENLQKIFSVLSQKPIYGVSSGRRSLTVFTTDGNIREILSKLHSAEGFKAISHRENVALLQVTHPMFVDSPGGVARISTALSQSGINIIEVTTSKATINVFIEENQLRKATEAISHVFET